MKEKHSKMCQLEYIDLEMPVYHPIRRLEKKTGNTDRQTDKQTEIDM